LPTDSKWYPLRADDWRQRLRDREVAVIDARCAELADRLGYGRLTEHEPSLADVLAARARSRAQSSARS
jgi:hypothetical protein